MNWNLVGLAELDFWKSPYFLGNLVKNLFLYLLDWIGSK